MKRSLLFLLLAFFSFSFSQTIKLQFEAGNFDELVKNKFNIERLSGEELYYIGYAFFRKQDDHKAIEFYDKALIKGFNNPNIYFQKGLSEVYINKYSDAIKSFNTAISLEPKAEFYIEKGRVYKLQKMRAEEIATYLVGLENAEKVRFYIELIKVAGNFYYAETEEFARAVEVYKNGISNFPHEYSFYEKVIKSLNAQNKFAEADLYFKKMRDLYNEKLLSEDMMTFKSIAVDEFNWKGQWLNSFKSFEAPKHSLESLYVVYLIDKSGDKIERKFNVEKTDKFAESDPQYVICEELKNSHNTYPIGFKDGNFNLQELREAIIEILSKNQKPTASVSFTH